MTSRTSLSDEPVRALAAQLGCEAVAPLSVKSRRQTWRVRRGGGVDLVLKCWSAAKDDMPYPVLAHRLLAEIDGNFRCLTLPDYLYDGYDGAAGYYVMMSFLPGEGYSERWHYTKPATAGGLALTPDDVDLALELLEDLGRVVMPPLLAADLKVVTVAAAVRKFRRHLQAIIADELIPLEPSAAIEHIVDAWLVSSSATLLRLSNADFRHLNFIKSSKNSVGIVDWDDAQASTFEIEHCVAYQWLLLWNRSDLQKRLVMAARERFGLDQDSFRAVLLILAVTQVHTCRSAPERYSPHLSQISRIIDDAAFARIWSIA